MSKFANISGLYLIVSAIVLVVLMLSFPFSPTSFISNAIYSLLTRFITEIIIFFTAVFGSSLIGSLIGSLITGIVAFSGIILLFTGFYLRTKFEDDSEQLRNIKNGIRLNMIHVVIILLLILYSIVGAHLD